MKKILAAFIIAVLMLSIAACDPPEQMPTEPKTTSAETPTTTQPLYNVDPVYENMMSISMPITTQDKFSDDGKEIFRYQYQSMHLIIPDRDVADKIIIDFLSRMDVANADADQMAQEAFDNSPITFPYTYTIQYDTMRIDQGVLSLYGHIIQNRNTMHADYRCVSASYDMVTGDVLTLGSILYHADAKDDLEKLVIRQLENQKSTSLYEDFRETVQQRFASDESFDEAFYFTTSGLCFYFSPYEIAPYIVGPITVEIPYNQLTGIIGDAYFPEEKTYTNGTIDLKSFDSVNLEDYDHFAEIICDEDGTKVLLTSDGFVQDVRIYQTEVMMDYTKDNMIFAAKMISDKDGILFEADFENPSCAYKLTYTQNGKTVTRNFIYNVEEDRVTLAILRFVDQD